MCLEEIAGVDRHNTGIKDWMICCWKNWLVGLLIRSSPMANTPALFTPTLPSSILLSFSLYVPFFQFSTFIFIITIICCAICLCSFLGRSGSVTPFVFNLLLLMIVLSYVIDRTISKHEYCEKPFFNLYFGSLHKLE